MDYGDVPDIYNAKIIWQLKNLIVSETYCLNLHFPLSDGDHNRGFANFTV